MVTFITWLIKAYQLLLSPMIGQNCRFTPTCSQYATDAFIKYGVLKGFYLSVRRIFKCHPWHAGGHDPLH